MSLTFVAHVLVTHRGQQPYFTRNLYTRAHSYNDIPSKEATSIFTEMREVKVCYFSGINEMASEGLTNDIHKNSFSNDLRLYYGHDICKYVLIGSGLYDSNL